jgi:UDP-N-acetylmuramoyl-L-alanyl-D-glutamate--2,6-diaminopimelate ligase
MKEIIKKFIPDFLLNWYHFLLAFWGALLYRFPSQKLKIIGITGTNGKTTTVEMTCKILEAAGYKVASLSSIKFKIGEKEWPNTLKMTMPGRLRLQKFLREAINNSCQYGVLEVTSQGIKQYRHSFINFEIAVFTNLSPEHIEAHGGFEKYREAKGKLFQVTKGIHILNLDDENTNYFLKFPAKKKYLYQISDNQVLINGEPISINLKLLGKFNLYNAAAAISVGLSQGIDLKICKSALEKIAKIPGRMEEVISQPFKVFVDYAFTPNALEKVYQILKSKKESEFLPGEIRDFQMICVLGSCGGGRDKWKRPVLGEIAAKYCNEVIITNEDPYDEDPMEIINQVANGCKNKAKKILDRREAIREALKLAKQNDLVIITGKGCEPWICGAKGKKIPWDDRQVVREEFEKLVSQLWQKCQN